MVVFEGLEIRVAGALRCPFCGSDSVYATSKDAWKKLTYHTVGVECKECGAGLRGEGYESYEGSFESAVRKWNRRAK